MVREIRGAKINPLKISVRKIRGGSNYASKYGISHQSPEDLYLETSILSTIPEYAWKNCENHSNPLYYCWSKDRVLNPRL